MARWPELPRAALRTRAGDLRAAEARLAAPLSTRPPSPDEALSNFDGFLKGLPAGVQLFSLFEANPPLVDLIVDICATAPGLSRYLSRHSGVLDAVLDGRFFAPWPGAGGLRGGADRTCLAGAITRRSWTLRGAGRRNGISASACTSCADLIGPEEAAAHYTDLADAVVGALWPVVCAEIARRHGPPPGRGRRGAGDGQSWRGADDARARTST